MPSIFRNAVCRSSRNHLKSGFAIYSVIDGSLAVFRVQSIYPLPTFSNRTAKRRSQRDWSPFTSFFPSIAFYAPNRRSFFPLHFTPQLYSINLSKPLPPYPTDDPIHVFQIERDFDLPSIYASIDKAEALLRKSVLSPERKKSIPTEKSLYLLSV